jgi:hypothetical protein
MRSFKKEKKENEDNKEEKKGKTERDEEGGKKKIDIIKKDIKTATDTKTVTVIAIVTENRESNIQQ